VVESNVVADDGQPPAVGSDAGERLRQSWHAEVAVPVHLCTGGGQPCSPVDASDGGDWRTDRSVSGDLVRRLLLERHRRGGEVDPGEVRLHGARITGQLDLTWMALGFPVALVDCHFDEPVTAGHADLAGLDLTGSSLPGLTATGLTIRGRILLDQLTNPGVIVLDEARIHGSLHAREATLGHPGPDQRVDGPVLNLDLARIDGGVDLTTTTAHGQVRLLGASIGGQLGCSGGSFTNPNGDALFADRAAITGSVFLNGGFSANGEVRRLGASIGGQLGCSGGSFTNPNGNALSADGAAIIGDVFLNGGFSANGEVRLLGASIGGQLGCRDGTFTNPNGDALSADGAAITGSVFLNGGFSANGEVRLPGATIGGVLVCSGGTFTNPNGNALSADRAPITGSVFLSGGFSANGEVRLFNASIGGNLACRDGTFTNPDGDALQGEGLRVNGHVLLDGHFSAQGGVSLFGASIRGGVSCAGVFTVAAPKTGLPPEYALNLDGVRIAGLALLSEGLRVQGRVSGVDARFEKELQVLGSLTWISGQVVELRLGPGFSVGGR
jgi:hypothetical protein